MNTYGPNSEATKRGTMERNTEWFLIALVSIIALCGLFQPVFAQVHYSKGITIEEISEENLTDYQIPVNLDFTNFDFSRAQPDGADVRFTTESGQPLDFWIEAWDPVSGAARIWVRVLSIPPISKNLILMHYGDGTTVSAENGTATFELFDDFDYPELWMARWGNEPDPLNWTIDTEATTITFSGGEIFSRQNFTEGVALHGYGMLDAPSGIASFGFNNSVQDPNLIQLFIDDTSNGTGWVQGYNRVTEPSSYVIMDALETPDYKKWSIMWPDTTLVRYQVNDGEINETTDWVPPGPLHVNIFAENASNTAEFDWVFVRKYISNEPAVTVSPLFANFSADRTSGPVNVTVQFTDLSNASAAMWNWSFGDGTWFNTTDPALKNANHTYTTPGIYNVSLTVGSGDDIAAVTKTDYISVHAENSAPVAQNDTFTAIENTLLMENAPGVLGNDMDSDGDPLAAFLINGPLNGTLVLNANGSFAYTPDMAFSGSDSFTYVAGDGALNSTPATVTIEVGPPPVGGDIGWFTVHCNVDGASVYFDEDYKGEITNGSLSVLVYTTATPYQTYTVAQEGYTTYTADITAYPSKDGNVDLYAKLYYTMGFMVPGVEFIDGSYVIYSTDYPGTLNQSGNVVTISGRSEEIPLITYYLGAWEGFDPIWCYIVGADLTTRSFDSMLPTIGPVTPYFEINLSEIPLDGQINIGILEGDTDESSLFYTHSSAAGEPLASIAYLIEVQTQNITTAIDTARIHFTVPRSWADTYGIENIRIFRQDNAGNITLLESTVTGITETEVTVMGYSPGGFSTFAMTAVQEKVTPAPSPTPAPTRHEHRDNPPSTPSPDPVPPEPEPPVLEPEVIPDIPEPIPDLPDLPPAEPGIFGITSADYFSGLASSVETAMKTNHRMHPIASALPKEIVPVAVVVTGIGLAGMGAAMTGFSGLGLSGSGAAGTGTGMGSTTPMVQRFVERVENAISQLLKRFPGRQGSPVFEKAWLFIRKVFGWQIIGLVGSKEIEWRKIAPKTHERVLLGISSKEIGIAAISIFLFGLAFAIAGRLNVDLTNILLFIVMGGIAVVGHEIVTNAIARHQSCDSEFQMWGLGSAIMFINAVIFGIAFGKPSRTIVSGTQSLPQKDRGLLLLIGPLVNIIFALISLYLIPFGGILGAAGAIGFPLNIMVSVYTLVPVHPLKGKGIYEWNKVVWALFFVPLTVLFISVYFFY